MNRNFENRKPTKVYANTKENQMIIKALNMYGRVPEMWELLKEIERLNNIINELEKYLNEELENYTIEIENKNKGKLGYTLPIKGEIKNILDKLNELKGDE